MCAMCADVRKISNDVRECAEMCKTVRDVRKCAENKQRCAEMCGNVQKCAGCAEMCGGAYKIFVCALRTQKLLIMCGVLRNLCARTLRTLNFKHCFKPNF